jgi:hypothetical protein
VRLLSLGPLLLHTGALAAAGIVLYRLFQRAAAFSRAARVLVALGVMVRAFAGIALFWISYTGLPVAKSLQTGDGFWFFAADGRVYFDTALPAAQNGLAAIILQNRTVPSVFFVQTLSWFEYVFGAVPSVAILLNVFCFVLTALAILSWGSAETGGVTRAALIPLAAVALSPSTILWSLQPLKDPLFACLIVALCAALAGWQRQWRASASGELRAGRLAATAAVIWALLYAVAGIRWYFALVLWCAMFVVTAVLLVQLRRHRAVCAAVSIALLLVLSRAVLWGGGPYIPETISRVLTPRHTSLAAITTLPTGVVHDVEKSRSAFDRVGGATLIGVASHPAPAAIPAKPQVTVADAKPHHETHPSQARSARQTRSGAKNGDTGSGETLPLPSTGMASAAADGSAGVTEQVKPLPSAAGSGSRDSATPPAGAQQAAVTKSSAPVSAKPAASVATKNPVPSPAASTARPPSVSAAPSNRSASGDHNPAATTAAVHPQPPISHEDSTASSESLKAQPQPAVTPKSDATKSATAKSHTDSAKVAAQRPEPAPNHAAPPSVKPAAPAVVAAPVRVPAAQPQHPAQAAPPPAAEAEGESAESGHVVVPTSHLGRFAAGSAAVFLPRFIAQPLHLVDIRGGRGMWFFTDVDTITFDLVLLFAFYAVGRAVRVRSLTEPVFWHVVLTSILVGGPLIYAVSNFGTLFRHRGMIYVTIALVPLSLARALTAAPPAGVAEGCSDDGAGVVAAAAEA